MAGTTEAQTNIRAIEKRPSRGAAARGDADRRLRLSRAASHGALTQTRRGWLPVRSDPDLVIRLSSEAGAGTRCGFFSSYKKSSPRAIGRLSHVR
jgi:hypothetical protein